MLSQVESHIPLIHHSISGLGTPLILQDTCACAPLATTTGFDGPMLDILGGSVD